MPTSSSSRAVVALACALAFAAPALSAHVYIPPPPPEPPPPEAPPPPPKVKLLVLDLKANDVDPATVNVIQGIVTARLAEYPELEVISGEDMRNMVQLEAERQSMGTCSEASCMAELADALGAELVVFGNVGALDNSKVLNLNLFDSRAARGLGRIVVQTETTDQMAKKLRPKLHELLGKYYAEKGLELPPLPPEEPEPVVVAKEEPFDPGPFPWIAAGVGGVLVAGGTASSIVGYLPLALYNQRRQDVLALEAQFKKDGKVSRIETARKAQSEMLDARNQWNSYGVILFDGGIGAASLGLALVIGGVTVGLLAGGDEEEAPADAAKPGDGPADAKPADAPAAEGGAQ